MCYSARMSFETDLLIDRRRLKRSLVTWRVVAVVAVAAIAALLVLPDAFGPSGPRIARLSVEGTITDDRQVTDALDAVAGDDGIRALIVAIDSPGGTVAGGEALTSAIARVAARKPVVAVMGGTAASAGYMIAMPAQRVFARGSTLTGSIGVILQTTEFSELMARVGIRAEALTSGSLKDQPSPFRPLTEEGRAALRAVIGDMYDQFVALVAKGRNLPPERVRELADGRTFTGRQALAAGLVDEIGGEQEARTWLAREKGVPDSLPVEDVDWRDLYQRTLARGVVGAWKTLISERLRLDGAWAVWQPSGL